MALNHTCCTDIDIEDPYFTPDEWDAYVERLYTSMKEVAQRNKRGMIPVEDSLLRERTDELKNLCCQCKAHHSMEPWILRLMDIAEPLNNAEGLKLAQMLIPQILSQGGIKSLVVEGCAQGLAYHVECALKLPSGRSVRFCG